MDIGVYSNTKRLLKQTVILWLSTTFNFFMYLKLWVKKCLACKWENLCFKSIERRPKWHTSPVFIKVDVTCTSGKKHRNWWKFYVLYSRSATFGGYLLHNCLTDKQNTFYTCKGFIRWYNHILRLFIYSHFLRNIAFKIQQYVYCST